MKFPLFFAVIPLLLVSTQNIYSQCPSSIAQMCSGTCCITTSTFAMCCTDEKDAVCCLNSLSCCPKGYYCSGGFTCSRYWARSSANSSKIQARNLTTIFY
uniref:Granulins domain-containing protein n=1 Tax=Strigamia maritima TaxID=126957 RepID=T1IXN9_STRMM